MREGKIRIILSGVFFLDDQIRDQIKDQTGLSPKPFCKHRDQLILIKHFPDDDTGPDLETAAPVGEREFLGDLCVRKIDHELIVREHKARVIRRHLSDDRSLGNRIPLVLVVFTAVLIQDVGCPALLLSDDLAFYLRYLYRGIEVHNSSYI